MSLVKLETSIPADLRAKFHRKVKKNGAKSAKAVLADFVRKYVKA